MSQLAWQKSSFSTGAEGECVEVATAVDGLICLRESDDPAVVVTVPPGRWGAFLRGIKAGEYDDLSA
ncbi:DUF397 domain-containing protein [Streptomyces pathocidini]|uniref:DUF397 domain-containing protein n=1 Tax=Streptomyces pathocidini TaxID=1650571 RepID=UPI0033FADA1C